MKTAIFLALALVVNVSDLVADGGVVVARREADGIVVTVLAEPVPLRVGRADFSVMVQDVASKAPITDCDLRIVLRPVDVDTTRDDWATVCNTLNGTGTEGRASTAHSNNKLLQSVVLGIPAPGTWSLNVTASVGSNLIEFAQELPVRPASPPLVAWWPLFALLPAAIGLYVLRSTLLHKRRRKTPIFSSLSFPDEK